MHSLPEWRTIVRTCQRRIRRWQSPPNWSRQDWSEEMAANAAAALCQAASEFEPARGVPLGAFAYRRVMAAALTRYRQEWAYASRFGATFEESGKMVSVGCDLPALETEALAQAMAELTASNAWLIEQIFGNDLAENEIAQRLGVSQQTINKRKKAVLRELRSRFRAHQKVDAEGR